MTALRWTATLLSLVALFSCRSDRFNDRSAALALGSQLQPRADDPERIKNPAAPAVKREAEEDWGR